MRPLDQSPGVRPKILWPSIYVSRHSRTQHTTLRTNMIMKYRLSAALLLAVVIPAAALRGQDAQKDLDKLQGTWVLTAMEKNGKAAPEYVVGKLTVTFKGETMVMDGPLAAAKGDEPVKPEFTVKLDPSKKPKAMDATPLNGKFK